MAAPKKRAPRKKEKAPQREAMLVPPRGPSAGPLFVIGAALVCAGTGTLLYPLFLTRAELAVIGGTATYGPLAAVAMMVAAVAILVMALNRRGMSEAPFALDLEERTFPERLIELFTLRFFFNTWKAIDAEALREREARVASGSYDWRPMIVLLSGSVFLALMEYFGHAPTLRELLDAETPPFGIDPSSEWWIALHEHAPFYRLREFVWWAGWRVLGFFLLPALVIKLVFRERISDYGLETAGFIRHAWIYLLFLGIVLVLVGAVSFLPEFSQYYPFYAVNPHDFTDPTAGASRSWFDFWTWEVLYAAQFFSLEFFFRGFWLKACKRSMGSHAIYAMIVPYCMIHFGKPFLETLGAILAGIALGTLALRTRSIWSGFLIHVSVAISMDLAALMQTTGLPDRWWPEL